MMPVFHSLEDIVYSIDLKIVRLIDKFIERLRKVLLIDVKYDVLIMLRLVILFFLNVIYKLIINFR